MAEYLAEGAVAPDFSLESDRGRTVRLSELRGRPVVLYFYPADDTPGCTTEACGFRDSFPDFGKIDAVVLGISPDDVASHQRFVTKYGLPFELLADPDHQVASAYGAWGTKNLYGKVFDGILRTTYLLDAQGRVAKVWKQVKVEGHAPKVLEAAQALPM